MSVFCRRFQRGVILRLKMRKLYRYPETLCDKDDRSSFLSSTLSPALIISRSGREELGEPPHQFVPLRNHARREGKYERCELHVCGELNNPLNACGGILFDSSHFSVFLGFGRTLFEICWTCDGGYFESTIVFITGHQV